MSQVKPFSCPQATYGHEGGSITHPHVLLGSKSLKTWVTLTKCYIACQKQMFASVARIPSHSLSKSAHTEPQMAVTRLHHVQPFIQGLYVAQPSDCHVNLSMCTLRVYVGCNLS